MDDLETNQLYDNGPDIIKAWMDRHSEHSATSSTQNQHYIDLQIASSLGLGIRGDMSQFQASGCVSLPGDTIIYMREFWPSQNWPAWRVAYKFTEDRFGNRLAYSVVPGMDANRWVCSIWDDRRGWAVSDSEAVRGLARALMNLLVTAR